MNKHVNCLIVDDEPLAIELLESHISQVPYLNLIASCPNAVEAFDVLKTNPVDLIFLDIQMPLITGMDFVRSLQHPPSIVFTTAYREYAVESYELNIVDYLLKPITFSRFFKAVNKYMDQRPNIATTPMVSDADMSSEGHMFVNANKKYVKVEFRNVLYIESIKTM